MRQPCLRAEVRGRSAIDGAISINPGDIGGDVVAYDNESDYIIIVMMMTLIACCDDDSDSDSSC